MLKEKYIEFRANKFREEHGMSSSEPVNLYKLLIKLNIITIFKELSEETSGMAVKTRFGKYILVNVNDIVARQNFTLGHELYHLFIQENFTTHKCKVGKFDKKDKEEYNADWFASYFLMPEDGLFEIIPVKELGKDKISQNTIIKLEQYFGVSRVALLNRLLFIDLISKQKKEELRTIGRIKSNARLLGYDISQYEPGNYNKVIGDYGEKAKRLYENESISETDFYNLILDIGIDLDKNLEEDV